MHPEQSLIKNVRRRFVHAMFATLGLGMTLGLATPAATASPAAPVNGVEYRTLEKPQSTEPGKKIEVTEFFWYNCPHCHSFEPALAEWVKKQGDNIIFKRVPVAFRESFQPQQKLYYTLEAMGKAEELQKKVFHAIHVERKTLDSDAAIADFVTSQGIDRKKFLDVYGSFGVQSKLKRAMQQQEAYKIDGVPLVAIDGRYLTSPAILGTSLGRQPDTVLQASTLQVMDWLLAKAAGDRKSASAAPAAASPIASAAKKPAPAGKS